MSSKSKASCSASMVAATTGSGASATFSDASPSPLSGRSLPSPGFGLCPRFGRGGVRAGYDGIVLYWRGESASVVDHVVDEVLETVVVHKTSDSRMSATADPRPFSKSRLPMAVDLPASRMTDLRCRSAAIWSAMASTVAYDPAPSISSMSWRMRVLFVPKRSGSRPVWWSHAS